MSAEGLLQVLQAFDPHAFFPPLDTAYSKYFASNYVASKLDLPTIREIVSQRREQLNTIDTIIKQTHSILNQLYEKREQIESSMTMHEGFISCVRRLPLDIFEEIFMQCLPNETYLTPSTRTAPLLLTMVCRGWREVALRTPRLWSSLSTVDGRYELDQRFRCYQHWLGKSRNCPISLEVLSLPMYFGRLAKMTTDFLQLYTGRCTELCVVFEEADALNVMLMDLPVLERLTLRGDMTVGNIDQTISIVQPRPRLRTLTIDTPAFDIAILSSFHPGWTNLTRLVILIRSDQYRQHVDILWTLLQMCPNLEHFAISPLIIHEHDDPVSCTHPKLRTLDIGKVLMYGNRSLFDTLTFPNLSHLRIRDAQIDVNAAFNDIPMLEDPLFDGLEHHVFDMTIKGDSEGNVDTILTVFNTSWMELTHIRLDIPTGSHFCLIPLRFCPRLDSMVVSMIDPWTRSNLRPDPFTHPVLRSLTIRVNCGTACILLDMLTLPNLCHLEMTQNLGSWSSTNTAKFLEFLARSNCSIEKLKIRARRIPVEECEGIVSSVHTLRSLDLDDTAPEGVGMSESRHG